MTKLRHLLPQSLGLATWSTLKTLSVNVYAAVSMIRAAGDTVSNWREVFVLLEQQTRDLGTFAGIGLCWRSPWFWYTIPIVLRLHHAAVDSVDGNDLGISKLSDAARAARAALRAAQSEDGAFSQRL
eukprot:3371145-Pyramimonas_sp.AAC.1